MCQVFAKGPSEHKLGPLLHYRKFRQKNWGLAQRPGHTLAAISVAASKHGGFWDQKKSCLSATSSLLPQKLSTADGRPKGLQQHAPQWHGGGAGWANGHSRKATKAYLRINPDEKT